MKRSPADFRTPLARVEGLGAARAGTHHFLSQRISAVALVPLSIWCMYGSLGLVGANLAEVLVYLSEPLNAILLGAFLFTALYHLSLGIQVVIEDYIQQAGTKIVLLILNRFFIWSVGSVCAFALLRLAL